MSRKQINIRIDEDLCDFVDEMFPSHGGRNWFFTTCAERFRDLYHADEITPPSDGIDRALRELLTLKNQRED